MNNQTSEAEISGFCTYISREFGLNYQASRYGFLLNRIEPVMQKYDCRDTAEVISKCKKDLNFRIDLLNALTTNETWFYRHPEHFEILRIHLVPKIIKRCLTTGHKQIRIWSAGCSTGAELYSILITLIEALPDYKDYNIQLTGSDISTEILKQARKGVYSLYDLRCVPSSSLKKYFTELSDDKWQIKPEYAKMAFFEPLNLLGTWPARTFDIIFCRNTMIYFDEENKNKLISRFAKSLEPSGFFFTSTNEMIFGNDELGLQKLFLGNEIVYQKAAMSREMMLMYFDTPTDLLRAMNTLKNNSFYFELQRIAPADKLSARRAICAKTGEINQILNLLALNSINVLSVQAVKKNSHVF